MFLQSTGSFQDFDDGEIQPQVVPTFYAVDLPPPQGSARPAMAQRTRTEEQQLVFDLCVLKRQNIAITGPAGTGKSSLSREIIQALRDAGRNVAVTAPTGLAASNVGGQTLHRWGGLPPKVYDVKILTHGAFSRREVYANWTTTDVLFIDEISMVSDLLFETLEAMARSLRKCDAPWGGLQVVVCGDFMQLPPMKDADRPSTYCFMSPLWQQTMRQTVSLRTVFRQQEDNLVRFLNEIRVGTISAEGERFWKDLDRPLACPPGIVPTKIMARNDHALEANSLQLQTLQGQSTTFLATDSGSRGLLDQCLRVPHQLELKLGALVMLLKNVDDNLVNGTIGVVEGWTDSGEYDGTYPLVRFNLACGSTRLFACLPMPFTIEGQARELARRVQVPLTLAWAMSIHKAQGQSIRYLCVDIGACWLDGHAYTALSRAVATENLQIINFDKRRIKASQKVLSFYAALEQS